MARSGTLTVLGAGASADAGYPMAAGLLSIFEDAVDKASQREAEDRERVMRQLAELKKQAASPLPGQMVLLPEVRDEPTTSEWFRTKWERYESVTRRLRPLAVPKLRPNGRPELSSPVVYDHVGVPVFPPYTKPVEGEPPSTTPYLETFFAFYDDYMRPQIAALEGDLDHLVKTQFMFRRLRKIAVETAYRVFSAYGRPVATYLRPLFRLRGPEEYACVVATLNFDVTIEQTAHESGIAIWDGFEMNPTEKESCPLEWDEPGLENLSSLWRAVTHNSCDFVGFTSAPLNANLLLKIHGSLGWYVLEEGVGDIGSRDELRHNTAYKHFRVPYELLWQRDTEGLVSRKAGAIWIRPYLVFARALKAHPERISADLTATFARLLDRSSTILVIGYSWADPHVNDLILDAVARGACLVNISRTAVPESVLALWIHRFPTTFHVLRRRLFMFGGGAKRVLETGKVELPCGESLCLDLVDLLTKGLPAELSLEKTLPQ